MKTNSFEGGSDSTTITTGNSGGASGDAFQAVTIQSGTTATYSATHPAHGSLGAKFTTGGNQTFVEWQSVGNLADHYGRRYFYLTGNPSGVMQTARFRDSASADLCSIRIDTAGKLRIFNAAGTSVATAGTALDLNTLWRVEYHIVHNAATGSVELRVFAGDSTSQDAGRSLSASSINTGGTTFDRSATGIISSVTVADVYMDDFVGGATDWTGPVGGGGGTVAARRRLLLGVGL